MKVVAALEAVRFIREHGGQLFVWVVSIRYGAGNVFVLEASTDSPGPEHDFRLMGGDDFDVLLDTEGREPPEELHVALRGRLRKQLRAYWNGNSFTQD